MRNRPRALVLFWVIVSACAGNPAAPIEDRSRPGAARGGQSYAVLRGDTLFSIAFRYGLDYRRLAAANAIAPPYTIFPGQRLILREARARAGASAAKSPGPLSPGSKSPGPLPPGPQSPDPWAPAPAKPRPKAAPAKAKAPSPAAAAASAPARAAPPKAADSAPPAGWRWPVAGRVIRRFDGKRNKGIDIAGPRGDVVRATRAGRVVYAGTGIAGYGLMLILRHSEEYLSAYGHSDALLVEEGDTVRAGQPVARRGSSGTDSMKLHFEIRRHGRPLDPLSVLPAR